MIDLPILLSANLIGKQVFDSVINQLPGFVITMPSMADIKHPDTEIVESYRPCNR